MDLALQKRVQAESIIPALQKQEVSANTLKVKVKNIN